MIKKKSSLHYLKIFFFVLLLTILISLIIKSINLYITSSFKNNTFSVLYLSKESKVIFVDKKEKSVNFLSVGDVSKITKGKSPLGISIALGIPINAVIYDEEKQKNPDLEEFVTLNNQFRLLLSLNSRFINMNEYDLFKIASIIRNVKRDKVKIMRIDLFNDNSFKNSSETFLDSEIKNSRFTVEIVNGTNINGLANSLASVLVKLGYNVVFLQTVPGTYKDDSYIGYKIKKDLFVSSLADFTNFEEKHKTISPSADVTIYLGSDLQSQFND